MVGICIERENAYENRNEWERKRIVYGIQWDDGMVPYRMAKSLITKAVMGITATNDNIVVYIKGHEKREWLRDLLLDEARRVYVENIEAHYEDIESLNKLDVTHSFRCQKHVKNCTLQNVFKIYNWWHRLHDK